MSDEGHAERPGACGHLASDAPHANQAKCLAFQLGAGERLLVPYASLHRRIGRRHGAREREHERQRMFGYADAVGAGRVHDEDPARGRCGQIDVVDAGAGAGNHPKARPRLHESIVHLRGASNDQRVSGREVRRERIARSARARVNCPTRNAADDFFR